MGKLKKSVNMEQTYDPMYNKVSQIFSSCDRDGNGFLDRTEI